MQEDNIYEYAVIRFVPKIEREEFFNIGLVLFSKKAKYIKVQYALCPKKLEVLGSEIEFDDICNHLQIFQDVASGKNKLHPIAMLDIPERFRWLTAVRSAIIQTSRPHPGISKNLDYTFEKLFKELVL